MGLSDVKFCKIYPGIGIARVGDSADEFFVGPESPGMGPSPDTDFKDAQGRIKRQAARFRVFGFDAQGKPVQELTALTPGAKLQWSVTLANRKAAGNVFQGVKEGLALDQRPDPTKLRNKAITDRSRLEITPAPRSIEGIGRSGSQFAFDDGPSWRPPSTWVSCAPTRRAACSCSAAGVPRAPRRTRGPSPTTPTMMAGMTTPRTAP